MGTLPDASLQTRLERLASFLLIFEKDGRPLFVKKWGLLPAFSRNIQAELFSFLDQLVFMEQQRFLPAGQLAHVFCEAAP